METDKLNAKRLAQKRHFSNPRFILFTIITLFLVPALINSQVASAEPFYTIQMSSNKRQENASAETDRLKQLGHNAFYRYEPIEGDGNWYTVYIGQYLSREEAEKTISELKQTFNVSSQSIRKITDPNVSVGGTPFVSPEKRAYTLHVSSFRKEAQAKNEIARFKKLGLDTYYKKTIISGNVWFRVYIGQFDDKTAAREKGIAFKQSGIINFYMPIAESGKTMALATIPKTSQLPVSKEVKPVKKEIEETSKPEISIIDKKETPPAPVIPKTETASEPEEKEPTSVAGVEADISPHPPQEEKEAIIQFKDLIVELLSTHDMVKYSEETINRANAGLKKSKSSRLPSLDLSSEGGHQKINYEDAGYTDEWRQQSTLRATQLISDFGRTKNTIQKSKTMLDKARYENEATRQKILIDGITAYLNLIRARENLKYYRKSEENIKTQTGIEEVLVKKGAGLSSNVLQAKSQLANTQALVTEAEGQLEIAKNRFRAIFKRTLTDEVLSKLENPPLRLIPRSVDSVVDVALNKNPYIAIAEADTTLSQSEVKVQKSTLLPRLNLFAEEIYSNNPDGFEGYKNETSAGLALSWNLFNGFGDKAGIQAALAESAASGNLLKETRHLIEEQARNAWQNLNTLKERTLLLENQTTIAAEFLVLARKERTLGNRTLLDILNGEVTYINAVSTAISSRIETKIAAYNLLYVTGELNPGML